MDDLELLDMAAKAASMQVVRLASDGYKELFHCAEGRMSSGLKAWSPLTDDGDALRLAVSLKLDVMFFRVFEEVCVQGDGAADNPLETGEYIEVNEKLGDDMAAVTRRAIVRAAAEIGKAMP